MATKTLWELMEAVAIRLDTVPLARAWGFSPGAISPPAAIVPVPPVDSYRAAFNRGTVRISNWPITILTSAQVDRIGQKALAEYLSWTGDNSVIAALESEPTLGGVVSDLIVESSRPLGLEEVGLIGYFGGEIRLTVQLPGI